MARPLTQSWTARVAAGLAVTLVASLAFASSAQAIDAPAEYTNQNVWNNYIAPQVAAGSVLDLGDLAVTLKPGAKASDLRPIASVTTAAGAHLAPATHNRQGGEFYLMDNTYLVPSETWQRTDARAAGRGLDGGAIAYDDSDRSPIAGSYKLSDYPGYTESGYFRYVLTVSSNTDALRPHEEGVGFYDAILYWDKTTDLLSVVSSGPTKLETSTTLAASGTTQTSTTLTATVTPADAAGTVTFSGPSLPAGGQAATVTNGTASISVSDLTPGTDNSFTASFGETATHLGSSATAITVTTEPVPAEQQSSTDVTITVPAVEPTTPTGLRISTKPAASIALAGTGARADGQAWNATGVLGNVTVRDDRQNAAATGWTLSGAATAFSAAGGAGTIAASELSWTPNKVSGAGTAGAAGAITTAKTLASGTASAAANVETTVGAGLSLNVPATAAAGNYTAKLTLTLI